MGVVVILSEEEVGGRRGVWRGLGPGLWSWGHAAWEGEFTVLEVESRIPFFDVIIYM